MCEEIEKGRRKRKTNMKEEKITITSSGKKQIRRISKKRKKCQKKGSRKEF